jgi:hypothetical protein
MRSTSESRPNRINVRLQGRVLDADISWILTERHCDLILESRSGAKGGSSARNTEYIPALEEILRRLANAEALIEVIQVVSNQAMKLPESQRTLSMEFPIILRPSDNTHALRLNITQTQRQTARTGRAQDAAGGNNTKRLLLRVRSPSAAKGLAELLQALMLDG